MDYTIIFVGIIMIAGAPEGSPYRALLPESTGNLTFCAGNVTVPRHEAYIRVSKKAVDNDKTKTDWPEGDRIDCERGVGCELFRITAPSDITIASGFDPGIAIRELPRYCLLPKIDEIPRLMDVNSVNEEATIASLQLPGGDLYAKQLNNGAIYPFLDVKAPRGAKGGPLTITATERGGSRATRSVVVKEGTTIRIVNATPEMAKKKLSAVDPHADDDRQVHYVLLSKLLPGGLEVCRRPAANRHDRCPGVPFDPTVTGAIGCSGSGCCSR